MASGLARAALTITTAFIVRMFITVTHVFDIDTKLIYCTCIILI